MSVRPVSGVQTELAHGPLRAQIGQVAAVLRGFWHGDDALTETWPDDCVAPMGAGIVLVPWPNRVAKGKWQLDGAGQQLDLTEPGRGHATHGLLRNTPYEVVEQTPTTVTHATTVYPQHGYPFTLDTTVTHTSEAGLTVTHTLTNVGTGTAPVGIGNHPYLRVGTVPAAELTVTVSARTRAVVDGALIPTDLTAVQGTDFDLRAGRLVGSLGLLDTAFTDLDVTDGRVEHRLAAPDGRSLVVWADADFGWVQLFTPAIFPGPGQPDQRTAIAVETMTCAADAFNNGWGLHHLAPGAGWTVSWGLRPEGF